VNRIEEVVTPVVKPKRKYVRKKVPTKPLGRPRKTPKKVDHVLTLTPYLYGIVITAVFLLIYFSQSTCK
jgi:hypothetical protein